MFSGDLRKVNQVNVNELTDMRPTCKSISLCKLYAENELLKSCGIAETLQETASKIK